MKTEELEEIEIDLLIEAIRRRYGHDFSQYARASLNRRIRNGLSDTKFGSISEIIPVILHDPVFFETFFIKLSINTTEMFRDPSFYLALRKIAPYLKTYPFIKIWIAGCSTGEEVYSTAILLKEEGLYNRSLIYATDFNDNVLENAKKGIYQIENLKKYTLNYQKSGGKESFGEYYYADYKSFILNTSLKKNIVFANHNLVTDSEFGEMNMILCRNVLIYFNRTLQDRVFSMFSRSLCNNGFLCLGSKETIRFSTIRNEFVPFNDRERIFQKKYQG